MFNPIVTFLNRIKLPPEPTPPSSPSRKAFQLTLILFCTSFLASCNYTSIKDVWTFERPYHWILQYDPMFNKLTELWLYVTTFLWLSCLNSILVKLVYKRMLILEKVFNSLLFVTAAALSLLYIKLFMIYLALDNFGIMSNFALVLLYAAWLAEFYLSFNIRRDLATVMRFTFLPASMLWEFTLTEILAQLLPVLPTMWMLPLPVSSTHWLLFLSSVWKCFYLNVIASLPVYAVSYLAIKHVVGNF